MIRLWIILLVFGVFLGGNGNGSAAETEALNAPGPMERRQALLEAGRRGEEAMPRLQEGLQDQHPLVRRTALRILVNRGRPALPVVKSALKSPDAEIRRLALFALHSWNELTEEEFRQVLKDEDELVRREAVSLLSKTSSAFDGVKDLLREAGADPSPAVRAEVFHAIVGEAESSPLREKFMDRAIDVVRSIPLPAEGWKFAFDPDGMGQGHLSGWFREDYEDGDWADARIETVWKKGYVGVGWYRYSFAMPARFDCDGVEMHFSGVDECAWLWVNGQYAGAHDIGPVGWNVPFSLDITDLVRWGETNQMTVRVMNTRMAGGIWKPVALHFLKVR